MMNYKTILFILLFVLIGFLVQKRHTFNFGPQPTTFSTAAFAGKLLDQAGGETTLEAVLQPHRGETVVVEIWASWCGDCLKGLADVKKLQAEHRGKKVTFLFLSVDEEIDNWKRAIKKHDIQGEHFFIADGWESDLGKFLKLSWIPRYLVVNKDGKIELYNAIKASDPAITTAIQTVTQN